MSYQPNTSRAFPRRTFLKTAGFATLCSLVAPLQSLAQSQSSSSVRGRVSTSQEETLEIAALRARGMECPNCHVIQVTKKRHSSGKQNVHCQTCGASLLNPTLTQRVLK